MFYARRACHRLEEGELNNDILPIAKKSRASVVIDKGGSPELCMLPNPRHHLSTPQPRTARANHIWCCDAPLSRMSRTFLITTADLITDDTGAWVFPFLAAAAPKHGMPAGIRMTRGNGLGTPSEFPRPPLLHGTPTSGILRRQQLRLHF